MVIDQTLIMIDDLTSLQKMLWSSEGLSGRLQGHATCTYLNQSERRWISKPLRTALSSMHVFTILWGTWWCCCCIASWLSCWLLLDFPQQRLQCPCAEFFLWFLHYASFLLRSYVFSLCGQTWSYTDQPGDWLHHCWLSLPPPPFCLKSHS